MKYVIRNYGETQQIPCKNGPVILAHDGVIETNDEELVAIADSIDTMCVTTRPNVRGAISEPAEPVTVKEKAPKSFDKMKMAELRNAAKKAGIKLSTHAKKAEIVELLLEDN